MDETPQEHLNATLIDLVDRVASSDPFDEHLGTAIKNLQEFSKIKVYTPEPEPTPEPVPTTFGGKALARTAKILDNETTRTLIKAAGAFGGVALVTWTTIHRDHVLERNALAQANQRTV